MICIDYDIGHCLISVAISSKSYNSAEQTTVQWGEQVEVQQPCVNLTIKIHFVTFVSVAGAADLGPDSGSRFSKAW